MANVIGNLSFKRVDSESVVASPAINRGPVVRGRNTWKNKLLIISINFTPKTSHSCLRKWSFPMFSRYSLPVNPTNHQLERRRFALETPMTHIQGARSQLLSKEALLRCLSGLGLCWHRTPPTIAQLQGAHSELLCKEALVHHPVVPWSLLAPDSTRNRTTSRCP